MEKEIWKKVIWLNNNYEVSNFGNVRSLDHYCENRKGSGKQTGRLLKLTKSKKGYLRVTLSNNNRNFTPGVHRLVALAFIPNPENKPQVNHINGIKNDNRVENLEWCTGSENVIHAFNNGFRKKLLNEKNPNSKLTINQVLDARKLHLTGIKSSFLARKYNVSFTAMSNILNNKTYKEVK